MKICIFSDIHGNQYALKAFMREISNYDIDQFIFCGDIFGYYYGLKLRSNQIIHINLYIN